MARFHGGLRLLGVFLALLAGGKMLPAVPEKWADEIAAIARKETAQPAPRDPIIFVGSSSIRLWTTLADDFPGLPVLNHGFGGSVLADSVFYFDRLVRSFHPRIVVLYAGENDLDEGKTPEAVTEDFRAFCAKIDRTLPDTRLCYISIKPSPSRAKHLEAVKRANALIAAECARDPRRTFVDVFPQMLAKDGGLRPELFQADLLHLNAQGYAIWTRMLAPLLKP